MRKLGIDLGTKRVGFAITDELNMMAHPLENFGFDNEDFNLVIDKIKLFLQEYKIDLIILGHPLRMDGTKSKRTLLIEHFKNKIESELNLKVVLVDERMSSKKANSFMIQNKMTRKKRKQNKDKMAAQIILGDYLTYY